MENLVADPSFWKTRRVFVTGHTGFKGGWLSLALEHMGANVLGYSLKPETTPNLFEDARIALNMESHIADICDFNTLKGSLEKFQPEIIFHLAAQAIVSKSYISTLETYQTNVIGTANLLEAAKSIGGIKAIVIATSDKCYQNNDGQSAFKEEDPLGGKDPYSASKACAEIVTHSYRESFFNKAEQAPLIATARAGNVIGGGDWSNDRLIPDLVRAFRSGKKCDVRNPHAIRPWQHVMEPIFGYLMLAQNLTLNPGLSGAWNFGPNPDDAKPVEWVIRSFTKRLSNKTDWEHISNSKFIESKYLKLDSSKANNILGWQPKLDIERAIEITAEWYEAYISGQDMRAKTIHQLKDYLNGQE